MLLKLIVTNTQSTQIFVDIKGDWENEGVPNHIVQEAIKKAQHEIEWFSDDEIELASYSLATEEEKKFIKESNEPVYLVSQGMWI